MAQYKKKCIKCGGYFEPEHGARKVCEDCSTGKVAIKRTDLTIKREIREVYRELWLNKRKTLVLSAKYRRLKNELLGLDVLEAELKEKYPEDEDIL